MISLAIINNTKIMSKSPKSPQTQESHASTPPKPINTSIKAAKLAVGNKIVVNNNECVIESITHHPDRGYISVITDKISMGFTPNQNVNIAN
jgi:hypothetical protein